MFREYILMLPSGIKPICLNSSLFNLGMPFHTFLQKYRISANVPSPYFGDRKYKICAL